MWSAHIGVPIIARWEVAPFSSALVTRAAAQRTTVRVLVDRKVSSKRDNLDREEATGSASQTVREGKAPVHIRDLEVTKRTVW